MLFIKGGEILAGIFLAVDLDKIPVKALGMIANKILGVFKNPTQLLH